MSELNKNVKTNKREKSSDSSDSSDSEEVSDSSSDSTSSSSNNDSKIAKKVQTPQFSVMRSDSSGLRMKIAAIPPSSVRVNNNNNSTKKSIKTHKLHRKDKKKVHDGSSSSCCSACTDTDSDSSSDISAKKRMKKNLKSKHLKRNNSLIEGTGEEEERDSTDSDSSDGGSSDGSSNASKKASKLCSINGKTVDSSTKNISVGDVKSTIDGVETICADGGSSSDMELPALVNAVNEAIQRVESCSDGESSKNETKTQYTSILLRDFMVKTQMLGSSGTATVTTEQDLSSSKTISKPTEENSRKSDNQQLKQQQQKLPIIDKALDSNETIPIKRKRGRPKKQTKPVVDKTPISESPDSGIISTPHSPVQMVSIEEKNNSNKTITAVKVVRRKNNKTIMPVVHSVPKLNISSLEKSMYATERVLYPPRRKRRDVNSATTSKSMTDDLLDPLWRKIDINKKFRRPSVSGYKSDGGSSTICSKILAAQSNYLSDYGNVTQRYLSGYKSDYSCKSKRSGYKSDYSVKAKSCGYRSDCSIKHRKRVRRKRRMKCFNAKSVVNDTDILQLAGLSLGQSEDSSRDSIHKSNTSLIKKPIPAKISKAHLSRKSILDRTKTITPGKEILNNLCERVTKRLSGLDNPLYYDNGHSTSLSLADLYKRTVGSPKGTFPKIGLITGRRLSTVSHCSSRSGCSRQHFRRRRRKRLKSQCRTDNLSKTNLTKLNMQIEMMTNSFASLCQISVEKSTKEKIESANKSTSKRIFKKRKGSENATENLISVQTTTSKRRHKKSLQTQSPDDHKLPLKKRHYLMTPGEKSDAKNQGDPNNDAKLTEECLNEKLKTYGVDSPRGGSGIGGNGSSSSSHRNITSNKMPATKAVTPKKRHLLETPFGNNATISLLSTELTSKLTEMNSSQESLIEPLPENLQLKYQQQMKKNDILTRKKIRLEGLVSKIMQPFATVSDTNSTISSKNNNTTRSINNVRTMQSIPPPGVFEPTIDLELQIPSTTLPIIVAKTEIDSPALLTEALGKFVKDEPNQKTEKVVESLLSKTGGHLLLKKKRKKQNRTGFPTIRKKKKKSTDLDVLTLDTKPLDFNINFNEPTRTRNDNNIIPGCDRVPKSGEAASTFIERNSRPRLSVVSLERLQGKPQTEENINKTNLDVTKQKSKLKSTVEQYKRARDSSVESTKINKKYKTDVAGKSLRNVVKNLTSSRDVSSDNEPLINFVKRKRHYNQFMEQSLRVKHKTVNKFKKENTHSARMEKEITTIKTPTNHSRMIAVDGRLSKCITVTNNSAEIKIQNKTNIGKVKRKIVEKLQNDNKTSTKRTNLKQNEKLDQKSKDKLLDPTKSIDNRKDAEQQNKLRNEENSPGNKENDLDSTNQLEKTTTTVELNDERKEIQLTSKSSTEVASKGNLLQEIARKSKLAVVKLKVISNIENFVNNPIKSASKADENGENNILPHIDNTQILEITTEINENTIESEVTINRGSQELNDRQVKDDFTNKSKTVMKNLQTVAKDLPSEMSNEITNHIKQLEEKDQLEHDPLPLNEGSGFATLEITSDSSTSTELSKKSLKFRKKYLCAGLFSDYYKETNRAADKLSYSRNNYSPEEHPTGLLPPPAYCEKYFRRTQLDFNLPYDLWFAHENGKLPGRNSVPSWNYRKIRTNVYNDIRAIVSADQQSCSCKFDSGCGDDCLNRLMYTECSTKTCPCGDKCQNTKIQRHLIAPGVEKFMTENKGWGVKAKLPIKKGTYILEYVGEIVTEKEFKERMATMYQQDNHHYCLNLDGGLVIDGHRMGSDCRFVNHSCSPNCEMQKWSVNGLFRMALFAMQNIEPNEELTYDYNFSLFNPTEGQPCRCETPQCRGVIGGKSQRIKPIDIQAAKFGTSSNKGRTGRPRKNQANKNQSFMHRKDNTKILQILMPTTKEQCFITNGHCFLLHNLRKIRRIKQTQITMPIVPLSLTAHISALRTPRNIRTRGITIAEHDPAIEKTARIAGILREVCEELANYKDKTGQILITKLNLPSKRKCPQYYEKIKKPVDLSLIEINVEKGLYKHPSSFDDDVLYMLANTVKYYGATSAESSAAQRLLEIYSNKKQRVFDRLSNIIGGTSSLTTFCPNKPNQLLSHVDPNEDIIRCICGLFKDEGLMIQCSKCLVWQHTECMGADTSIDNYACEKCDGRTVDLDIPLDELTDEGYRYYLSLMRGDLQIRQTDTVYVLRDIPIQSNDPSQPIKKHTYKTIGNIDYIECDIFRVERMWKDNDGNRFVFGHHYLRPHETYHEPSRKFYQNEVVRVPLYEVVPIELIMGRCWVFDPAIFCKGRPVDCKEEDHVYICEWRVDKAARLFSKIQKHQYPVCQKSYAFNKFQQKLKISRNFLPHDVKLSISKPKKKKSEEPINNIQRKNTTPIVQLMPPPPKTLNQKRIRLEGYLSKMMIKQKNENENLHPLNLSYLLTGRGTRRRANTTNVPM